MDPKAVINGLVSDRAKFGDFVYTPLDEAVGELKRRRNNKQLQSYVKKTLAAGIPPPLETGLHAVMFRQVVTPNHEIKRFLDIVDMTDELEPLFLEYFEDKFTDNNDWKYFLGKMGFYSGRGKKGGEKIQRVRIIDFNTHRGKRLSEVKTLWGQGLIDFHHEIFKEAFRNVSNEGVLFDASNWFSGSGGSAINYYKHFLSLFLVNGILFENFLLDSKEIGFTREVFLPAFLEIMKESGVKPLIVALEPPEIESEEFWMCHPATNISFVNKKLGL